MHHSIARLFLILLCFALAPAAWAQPADDVARTHFERGKQLAASGKFADAYREFEAGYTATPRPAFLFNMGEAARGMGDVAKAREAYQKFLAAEPGGSVADTARQRLAELDRGAQPAPAQKLPTPSEAAQQHASTTSAAAQPVPAPREGKPLWKKWPLWAAVGGAVVTGAVIAAVSLNKSEPSCGEGCIDLR